MLAIQFFFVKAETDLRKQYAALFKSGSSNVNVIKNKDIIEPFGWLNTVYDLAEKKIFDLTGYNSIDSLLGTNAWQVLSYMQWDNKRKEFETEVRKSTQQEAEQKAKQRSAELRRKRRK